MFRLFGAAKSYKGKITNMAGNLHRNGQSKPDQGDSESHISEFTLTPITEFCSRFIFLDENAEEINSIRHLKECVGKLKSLLNEYEKLKQNLKPPVLYKPKQTSNKLPLTYDQHKYLCIIDLINTFLQDSFKQQQKDFNDAIENIKLMKNFFENNINRGYIRFTLDIDSFIQALTKKKVAFDKYLDTLFKNSEILNTPRQPITKEQLKEKLNTAVQHFKKDILYMPESDFDYDFETYALLELDNNFQQVIYYIKRIEFTTWYSQLNNIVEDLISSLNLELEIKKHILKICAYRYLFNRITIEASLSKQSFQKQFFKNCESIQGKSPAQLDATTGENNQHLFDQTHYTMSVKDIYQTDPHLREAVDILGLLTFKTSPFDIAFTAREAAQKIYLYTNTARYIRTQLQGNESAEIPPNAIPIQRDITFETHFLPFHLAFAVNPPPNISTILQTIKNFPLTKEFPDLQEQLSHIQASFNFIRNLRL